MVIIIINADFLVNKDVELKGILCFSSQLCTTYFISKEGLFECFKKI